MTSMRLSVTLPDLLKEDNPMERHRPTKNKFLVIIYIEYTLKNFTLNYNVVLLITGSLKFILKDIRLSYTHSLAEIICNN